MAKEINKKQREILARKLGYDGPMNMFDQFVKSDPAMERKYNTVITKYMARGGVVKKYAEGGVVEPLTPFKQMVVNRLQEKLNTLDKSARARDKIEADKIREQLADPENKIFNTDLYRSDQFLQIDNRAAAIKNEEKNTLAELKQKGVPFQDTINKINSNDPATIQSFKDQAKKQLDLLIRTHPSYKGQMQFVSQLEGEKKEYVDSLNKVKEQSFSDPERKAQLVKQYESMISQTDLAIADRKEQATYMALEGIRSDESGQLGMLEPSVNDPLSVVNWKNLNNASPQERTDFLKKRKDYFYNLAVDHIAQTAGPGGQPAIRDVALKEAQTKYDQTVKPYQDKIEQLDKNFNTLYDRNYGDVIDVYNSILAGRTGANALTYNQYTTQQRAAGQAAATTPTVTGGAATTPTVEGGAATTPTVTGGATQEQMQDLGLGTGTTTTQTGGAAQDTITGGAAQDTTTGGAATTTTPTNVSTVTAGAGTDTTGGGTTVDTTTATGGTGAADTVAAGTVQDQMNNIGLGTDTTTGGAGSTTTPTQTAGGGTDTVAGGTGTTGGTTTDTTTGTTAPYVPPTTPTPVQNTTTGGGAIPTTSTVPSVNIPVVSPQFVTTEAAQEVSTAGAPTTVTTVAGGQATAAEQVIAPTARDAVTYTPGMTAEKTQEELDKLAAVKGTVSEKAQVEAATMEPTSTAVKDLEAAQGVAGQVTGAPTREVVAGELVEGATVDRTTVEAELAKNEAAQGTVTEDMTVQGQLAKLTANFEASNPPAWAASTLRNVTAVLGERGLAASSLAGQALIQATLEAALPIATADAKTYFEMGIQNLSNKQQMAVVTAELRAKFLQQEFDQKFQTRVINAATISEIANLNFSAKQQIALENARLTESMNIANLNNRQALVLAEAAQIASLETTNLNNRQQAAVANARAFLDMDLANLSNEQQTTLFKAQGVLNSILSDQAAENAAAQFNASSQNQINQFYDGLATEVAQFNTSQKNAMAQFNVSQANAVAEFNASQQNSRDQFNADFRRVIDQSNAEWRRSIALADTAAINRANEVNANAALAISTAEYNNLWQTYRDQIEYAWKTGENALDRENELARQVLAKQATIESAKFQIDAAKYAALGSLAAQVFDKGGIAAAIGGFLGTGTGAATAGGFLSGVASGISNIFNTGGNGAVNWNELPNADQNNPEGAAFGWSYYSNGTDTVAIDPNGSVFFNGDSIVDDQLAYTGPDWSDWSLWSGGGL